MAEEKKKKKIGLVPKLIMGIIVGIIIGTYCPAPVIQVLVTISGLFSSFLSFVIPFIIIGFVTAGIADLATGAGKLLGITTGIAYGSTLVAGTIAFIVASTLFPKFINAEVASQIGDPSAGQLSAIFSIPLAFGMQELGICIGLALISTLVMEVGKIFMRKSVK